MIISSIILWCLLGVLIQIYFDKKERNITIFDLTSIISISIIGPTWLIYYILKIYGDITIIRKESNRHNND